LKDHVPRGHILKALITVPVAFAALAPRLVEAVKNSKAQFKYQDTPKNGQKCAACRFYIPGKTATSHGTCTLVAGSISPTGWCVAYAKR
jgi:hypothetical protein